MQPQLLSQILTALNKDHNSTIYDLLIATLRSRDPSHSHHRDSILTRFPDLFDLLSEQSSNDDFATNVVEAATSVCQEEIQTLILKQSGLHFDGSHTGLSQLEGFSIAELGQKVQQLAPHLWHMVGCLLDVVPDRRRTAPAEMAVDEDIEMEPADIAMAVEGNDEGSEESDDELEDGETVGRTEMEREAGAKEDANSNDTASEGDEAPSEEAENETQQPGVKKSPYRKQNRARRNAALIYIVSTLSQQSIELTHLRMQKKVVIIVIMGHSSNERFNALQCVIGFFLELKCTPEGVTELLAHMGVSASTQTTRNMVKSLTKSAIGRNKHLPRSMFIYDNFDMDFKVAQPTAGKIGSHTSMMSATFAPYAQGSMSEDLKFTRQLHTTSRFNKDNPPGSPSVYTPCIRDVMPRPEVLVDGLDSLHRAFAWHLRAILIQQDQSFGRYKQHLGLPDAINPLPVTKTLQFPASAINADESSHDGNWEVFKSLLEQLAVPDERLEDEIILIHGDLATKEKIDGLRKMRTIEKSAKNRLGFAVVVPGLFHLKMAATDAFWRTHVQPAEGQDDRNGFYEYVRYLRPNETIKFLSAPGFRRLHDTIHHTTWIDVLDCWRIEANGRGFNSRAAFADSKPSWASIIELSEAMVKRYLPGEDFDEKREELKTKRDMVFENVALRKQHGLLYLELSHAMNYGDVGRILRLLPYWIAIFKATGKSKYSAHMIRFMTDLDHVYPPRLRYIQIFHLLVLS